MNKKTIAVGMIAGALLVSPFVTSALTIADLQAQLKDLLGRISLLQLQSGTSQAGAGVQTSGDISVTAVPRICMLDFTSSLQYGSRGDDVRGLQEFLRSEGVFNAEATGYFGSQTQSALQKWQASQGIVSSGSARTSGWGALGPLTRARINARCGTTSQNFDASPRSGAAPLNVDFTYTPPTDDAAQYYIEYGDGQGQLMNRQQIYCIRAPCISPSTASHTYTSAGDYTATVNHYIACLYTNPRCMLAQPAPLASVQIHVTGATAGNRAPSISSFSGPTTLAVNQSGTWIIRASDPENGQLTYSIWWGDENVYAASNASTAGAAREFSQTTTFTHAYANAGTYTVSITVRDAAGLEAQSSSTVRIGNDGVACTMQYQPVCGRPSGCLNTCPPGMYCTMMCQLYPAQTYGNRCELDAAGAEFLYSGQCSNTQ